MCSSIDNTVGDIVPLTRSDMRCFGFWWVFPDEHSCECCHYWFIAICNDKRLLLDVHHDINPDDLKNHLNEFCWKFNRQYFGNGLFDRFMVAALAHKNDFRYNLA